MHVTTDDDLDAIEAYMAHRKDRDPAEQIKRKTIARNKIRSLQGVDANGARAARVKLIEQKEVNLERVIACEHEAWRLRAMGHTIPEIAELMQTTLPQVNVWLQDALVAVKASTKDYIELDRELELSRTELLLARYMPLALMESLVIERIRQGEPISEDDFDRPERSAWIVIELIKMRARLKGLVNSQAEQALLPIGDAIGWLRTQNEFIKAAAQAAPRDILTLETDTQIDEPTTVRTDTGSPESLEDAL